MQFRAHQLQVVGETCPCDEAWVVARDEQRHRLGESLDARAADLQKIDDARAWALAHTAVTRANADAARYLIAERHADDIPEPTVTAQEWLTAERAARLEDDVHRLICETDLDEHHTADQADVDTAPFTDLLDIRELAAAEPAPAAEDDVRIPTADEAQPALDEITAHEILDADELSHDVDHDDFHDGGDMTDLADVPSCLGSSPLSTRRQRSAARTAADRHRATPTATSH
ncbi:hypothetical protein SAMN05443637_12146 [Pseudonocardia thermophila]|uniref:Uncharacterized protein n=1 Tax=Pseudonocardia thermophila TaxID=1848 RepID=A0A1M6YSW8_PSETH|nr:hypothetical protein [Pseudonocardia thermophila]SHL21348.1 hypothetical protein SAMN05443637_12146 [Pseudonocardia thermophila]